MAYLLPKDMRAQEKIEWFNLCFWDPENLKNTLKEAARTAGCEVNIGVMLDRSIFVGRHIDTGLLSTKAVPIRHQVNRLLDHGYRGEVEHLKIDISHLGTSMKANPIAAKATVIRGWNRVIYLLEVLENDIKVRFD
jgi:hypothetical protein